MDLFALKLVLDFCLEGSVGAIPKNTKKANKARNAEKEGSPRRGFRQACSGWEC